MAAVIDNLKAALRFIKNFFDYIISLFRGLGDLGGNEGATE